MTQHCYRPLFLMLFVMVEKCITSVFSPVHGAVVKMHRVPGAFSVNKFFIAFGNVLCLLLLLFAVPHNIPSFS